MGDVVKWTGREMVDVDVLMDSMGPDVKCLSVRGMGSVKMGALAFWGILKCLPRVIVPASLDFQDPDARRFIAKTIARIMERPSLIQIPSRVVALVGLISAGNIAKSTLVHR